MSEEGGLSSHIPATLSIATTATNGKSNVFSPSQTHNFQISPSLAKRCHESAPDATPIILQGSRTSRLVIGRGHDATIKIGKANKCVSREHVAIEHKPHLNGFELTILSPNGALIDHIIFDQGEHVPLIEGTLIEIVGNKLVFEGPKEEEEIEEVKVKDIIPSPSPVLSSAQVAAVATTTTTTKTTTVTTKTKTVIVKEKSTIRVNNQPAAVKVNTPNNTSMKRKSMTLEDEIVQVLVVTRKSTMTCTDISNRIQGQQTFSDVSKILSESPVIGCIPRSGKLADGSLKEDLYYYKPELDSDLERRKKYSDVGRSARKCTMKDTQYFFRIPPKLPAHKASNNKIRKRANYAARERMEDEELISNNNSSDDASDMEVYELFKDV